MCRAESHNLPPCPCPAATVLSADIMPSHQLTQPMKPRLPRRLASSARINLNRYWNALEELIPLTRKPFDESDNNAINENIDNEKRLAAMRLSDTQKLQVGQSASLQKTGGNILNNIDLSGHKPSSSSSSSFSISNSISPDESSTFPRFSDSSSFSLMSEDESSSDENTPPSSFGNASR